MTAKPASAAWARRFAQALLDPDAAVPPGIRVPDGVDPGRRFAVHRNNVLSGLVECLHGRFPAVAAIVGRDFFDAMATVYVRAHPPADPVLATFGDRLPDFVAGFPPAGAVPYLADVARIEAARTRAWHAADDAGDAGAEGPPRSVADARLRLCGAPELVRSSFPVVTVWEMNAGLRPPAAIKDWSPEWALVLRCGDRVPVLRAGPAVAAVLAAARRGGGLKAAAMAAARAEVACDPAAVLSFLIEARAVAITARPPPARNR
ncbi:putative DNA-binding domain-containing protein [Stella sp.]|uniref:HvfC/BufC family peptide modification chaperone n=1 Tax=Stella sp. TaxID=2912054 RepID=UPI0035B3CCEC